ncbi:MAG: PD-(D/E)XK nuclease family protein [Patescibacteria group bacterium]
MSQYYNPKRTRNIFDPKSSEPFRLSRSKIDRFLECPRCFYLDRRLGVDRPPGFPFSLNSAVDKLLKKEFDMHRVKKTAHPLMTEYGIDAIPYSNPDLDKWRENFVGVQYLHEPTNFIITGAIDDVWVNPTGELIVVDYKATSKEAQVSLDADWQIGYKRQMEVYQWLLRRNGFTVSSRGYFVYCNGDADKETFDGKLEFDITVLPYDGNDDWIEKTIKEARVCLDKSVLPEADAQCDYCRYRDAVATVSQKQSPKQSSLL